MKLNTPSAIIVGFLFVALSIASLPYSNMIVSPAKAEMDQYDYKMFRNGLGNIVSAIRGIRACRN